MFEVKNFSVQNKTDLEFINLSVTDSSISIRAISYDNVGTDMCCAFYSSDGEFLELIREPITMNPFEFKDISIPTYPGYTSFKIFTWKNGTMIPISISKSEKDWF